MPFTELEVHEDGEAVSVVVSFASVPTGRSHSPTEVRADPKAKLPSVANGSQVVRNPVLARGGTACQSAGQP